MIKTSNLYITCPYCGKKVLMDWVCTKCKKKIEYDFDEKFRRYNPHKAPTENAK